MDLADLTPLDNPALKALITARIKADGPLPFDEFLRLALYHHEHGYYITCDPAADYQSSPNVHPVFEAMLARQVADFWRLLDRPQRFEVFEAGAGSLRLATSLLRGLAAEAQDLYEIVRYTAQDPALTGEAGERRLATTGLPPDRLRLAKTLPDTPVIEGCIISNELLDALPFRRVSRRDGVLYELKTGIEDDRLVDVAFAAPDDLVAYFGHLGMLPGEACTAEVNLAARDWTVRAANSLRRGYILTLDYGYEAADLYAPWRRRGTLLTFYRHTSDDDPYARIGRQDITASVDFTTVRRAGEQAGLTTLGVTTQTGFLAALGIGSLLARPPAAAELEGYYALRRAVLELTEPAGLGRIRVMLQGKGTPAEVPLGLQV